MKKIVLGAAFVAAAGFGTFTANQNNNQAQLSDLQLENVEILASGGEADSMIDHMWKVGNNSQGEDNNQENKGTYCSRAAIKWKLANNSEDDCCFLVCNQPCSIVCGREPEMYNCAH